MVQTRSQRKASSEEIVEQPESEGSEMKATIQSSVIVVEQTTETTLKTGVQCPNMKAWTSDGLAMYLSTVSDDNRAVLVVLPDISDPQCRQVAQAFNQVVDEFHKKDCTVWGLCSAEPKELRQFKKELDLQYGLLSLRPHHSTDIDWFHVNQGILSYFILEKGGHIIDFGWGQNPHEFVSKALKFLTR